MQALQKMVELAEHALPEPCRVWASHRRPDPQAPTHYPAPSMQRGRSEATYLPTATRSYLY